MSEFGNFLLIMCLIINDFYLNPSKIKRAL